MKPKIIMDSENLARAVTRISHEILERNKGPQNIALVGIRTGGVYLAKRIAGKILEIEKVAIPCGALDITLYRDDISKTHNHPVIKSTEINFSVDGMNIILVDDVLYTGRTIRAALDALMDLGRPKTIQLAVMIDRGHRELPIRADFVGKNLPTSKEESVIVNFVEESGKDGVEIKKS